MPLLTYSGCNNQISEFETRCPCCDFELTPEIIREIKKNKQKEKENVMEALIVINRFSKTVEQKRGIQKHAQMVLHMAEKMFDEPNDLQDLKERSKLILKENS